jgi:ABC-2 type transport system permease protein
MNKINAVIKKEYLTRVKKKSFIIITLLMPLSLIILMGLPFLFANVKTGVTNICVLDESGLFVGRLDDNSSMRLKFETGDIEELKTDYKGMGFDALVHIPNFDLQYPGGVKLFSEAQVGMSIISNLEQQISKIVEDARFERAEIDRELVNRLRTRIRIETLILAGGEEKAGNKYISLAISQIMGFFMYFMIFLYGSMIMTCVREDKKTRIVEILVSSIKPFELLLGKIIGIAAVAITQLLIWLVLGTIVMMFFMVAVIPSVNLSGSVEGMEMAGSMAASSGMANDIADFLRDPGALNIPLILFSICFYFLFGYLFYSTFFAAAGSLSDDESTQQTYTLPLTLPIILSLMIMINVIDQPHSPLAIWASIIPFSSPIVMLARIPFHVPAWQLVLSIFVLILSFVGSTWVSGKVYRTAILLFGKKFKWKEVWKFVVR